MEDEGRCLKLLVAELSMHDDLLKTLTRENGWTLPRRDSPDLGRLGRIRRSCPAKKSSLANWRPPTTSRPTFMTDVARQITRKKIGPAVALRFRISMKAAWLLTEGAFANPDLWAQLRSRTYRNWEIHRRDGGLAGQTWP